MKTRIKQKKKIQPQQRQRQTATRYFIGPYKCSSLSDAWGWWVFVCVYAFAVSIQYHKFNTHGQELAMPFWTKSIPLSTVINIRLNMFFPLFISIFFVLHLYIITAFIVVLLFLVFLRVNFFDVRCFFFSLLFLLIYAHFWLQLIGLAERETLQKPNGMRTRSAHKKK